MSVSSPRMYSSTSLCFSVRSLNLTSQSRRRCWMSAEPFPIQWKNKYSVETLCEIPSRNSYVSCVKVPLRTQACIQWNGRIGTRYPIKPMGLGWNHCKFIPAYQPLFGDGTFITGFGGHPMARLSGLVGQRWFPNHCSKICFHWKCVQFCISVDRGLAKPASENLGQATSPKHKSAASGSLARAARWSKPVLSRVLGIGTQPGSVWTSLLLYVYTMFIFYLSIFMHDL